jgi:hypothetical protein
MPHAKVSIDAMKHVVAIAPGQHQLIADEPTKLG